MPKIVFMLACMRILLLTESKEWHALKINVTASLTSHKLLMPIIKKTEMQKL